MKTSREPSRVRDIRLGRDVRFDAWLYSMLMDNNLAYRMNPDIIASPEQLAFMVQLDDDQVYLPCSDATFAMLRVVGRPRKLQVQYNRAWRIIMRLIRSMVQDRAERRRILHFCRYRFLQYAAQGTLIPSRLVKRMTDLVLAQSYSLGDPWRERRRASTLRQQNMLELPVIRDNLEAMPGGELPPDMRGTRRLLDSLELVRFFCLSAMSKDWQERLPSAPEIRQTMRQAEQAAAPLHEYFLNAPRPSTILFLCDADGGILFDLAMLQSLIRMGHRVICAVKAGFYFFAPTMDDMESDPALEHWLRGGIVLRETQIGKNDLLRHLRERRMVIIDDGTRERLNLYRVSVTFSRAWKEADVVLCKGWRAADIFLGTSHVFTRDIVCYWRSESGFRIELRQHAPEARKFSEEAIAIQADAIIKKMREGHSQGRSVMFYSCVIGSIPGQTHIAVTLARTFVDNLRKKMDNILIINPAEHFVEGMDGDDLMFMWERVQRSGLIDVWRFQTVKDIEESFALLGRKVPPAWSGKDSTYSTGCTKEMRIALDMQSRNREMQIIGPEPRLFFRRGEYGVGKYFDASISRLTGR
ncbi:ARMT1-like domain-containing protein [uncultured Desulfovibrio sp.]|uniref:ARMT1-like domain-containing protein n=1 Tax=uncultured Desulfovibrio sp. TaxID=167968 RepID=UPI00039B845C|nr:ARMT1-like domain-containing protein [uncultured Desulfovibrio sp.]